MEDCVVRETYTCQLVCISEKGSLLELNRAHFDIIKNNKQAWTTVMEDSIRKLNWSYGDFIKEYTKVSKKSENVHSSLKNADTSQN